MGATPNAVKAGGAEVVVGMNTKPFAQGMAEVNQRMKSFAAAARALGATLVIGSAFRIAADALSQFADTGSKLVDMSQRVGDSAANLSAIGYAAKQSGTELDALETGLSKMSSTIAGAIAGEKSSIALLTRLGLTAKDLQGKLPTDQLAIFADKLNKITDHDTKVDLVKSVFGKSGTDLIPLLSEGSAGMQKLMEEARKLGIVMSEKDAAAAAKFGDALDMLHDAAGAIVMKAGAALAPTMTEIAGRMTDAAASVSEFVGENKGLIVGMGAAIAALSAAGITIVGVGVVASTLATGLGVVAGAAAAIVSPMGLAIAAVASGGYAFVRFTEVGQAMGETIGEVFAELLQGAQSTLGGIADALGAGDVQLAADILWAGLEVAWAKGCDSITHMWANALLTMEEKFGEFGTNFRLFWQDLSGALAQPMAWVMAKMQGLDPNDVQAELVKVDKAERDKIAGAGWGKKIGERRAALDKADPELQAKLAELEALVEEAKLKNLDTNFNADDRVGRGRAATEAANRSATQLKNPEAHARGSAGAASAIANAVNRGMMTPEAKELKEVNQNLKEIKKALGSTGALMFVEIT